MTNVTTQDELRNAATGTIISFAVVDFAGQERTRKGYKVVSNHETSIQYGKAVQHSLLTLVSKGKKEYVIRTTVTEDRGTIVDMTVCTGIKEDGTPSTQWGHTMIRSQELATN